MLQLVVVWNTEQVSKGGQVSVMVKAHTDVDIINMKIAAFDESRFLFLFLKSLKAKLKRSCNG